MIELWSLVTLAVVALNVTVVAEGGTVTDPGTLSVLLVLVSITTAPVEGAALLSVTVHDADPFAPTVEGLHDNEDIAMLVLRLTVVLMAESPL
jgi:hypothetical protein